MIEDALVARAQAGDDAALGQLLREARQVAHALARRRLGRYGEDDEAEDVAQETIIAVSAGLPGYAFVGAPFDAYVRRIAARKIVDLQRARLAPGRRAVSTDVEVDQADDGPGPEQVALEHASVADLQRLVDTLPARDQTIVRLRANGLTAVQVAAQLGLTPGAVRVAHHRAVRTLRAASTTTSQEEA